MDAVNELWAVRHGKTEWSVAGKHTSTTDLPLLPEGEAVARGLRERLADVEFAQVLTSPRLRARRTAELAGFADAETDDDLAEWDYGDYEGITTDEIRVHDPGWTIWTHPTPGGETRRAGAGAARPGGRAGARGRGADAGLRSRSLPCAALAARWLGRAGDRRAALPARHGDAVGPRLRAGEPGAAELERAVTAGARRPGRLTLQSC